MVKFVLQWLNELVIRKSFLWGGTQDEIQFHFSFMLGL
jgi:hypothetical protein